MSTHVQGVSQSSRTPLEPLLTVADTALFLGVSRAHVYVLLERDELPHVRIGTRIRFVPDELRAYLERHREGRAP
jgi:excisionase family DNA binding protein